MNFETNQRANDNLSGKFYFETGKSAALSARAAAFALSPGLDGAYAEFQKRERNFTKERILQYDSEVQSIIIEKGKTEGELEKLAVQKQLKDDDIEDKKTELQKVRAGEVQANTLPFIIATLLIILLTLYLFMFYASTGYSAFFGIPSKLIGGFLAPTVFEDASIQGNGALMFIILFPIVFLAMGYVIHTFLEKKNYIGLSLVLLFTLAFDTFMAYKIAKNAHDLLFASGQTIDPWNGSLAYEDVNFYIIIAAGFVVYVIWGYLLNNVIQQWYTIQPDQVKQTEIEKIRDQILKLTNEASEYGNSITLLKSTLHNLDQKRADIERKSNILRAGGIVIDVTALKGMVGEFVGGWCFTINFLFHAQRDLADRYAMEANETANKWFDNTSAKLNDN
jgi:hypothetical protein